MIQLLKTILRRSPFLGKIFHILKTILHNSIHIGEVFKERNFLREELVLLRDAKVESESIMVPAEEDCAVRFKKYK